MKFVYHWIQRTRIVPLCFMFLLLVASVNLQAQNRDAVLAYNKALAHYNTQNYQFAIPYLTEAVTHDPTFEAAYHLLAISFDQTDQTRQAIQNYEKVLQLKPQQEKVLYNLSLLYSDNKQSDKAIEVLKKAIQIDPNYAKAHQRLGILYAETGNGEKAGDHYSEASKGGMNIPSLSEATAAFKAGNYQKALDKANEAIKNSDQAAGHYVKGLALSRLDRSEEAITSLKKATQKDPDYQSAWTELGIIQYNLEKFQDASQSFSKTLQIDSEDAEINGFYGRSLVSSNQHGKAIDPLKKALEAYPSNGELHFYLAEALKKEGRSNDADHHFAKAKSNGYEGLTSGNSEKTKFYNAGILAYRAENYREAIQQFKKAIQEDPKVAKYHYNLGLTYTKDGQKADAKKAFEQSLNLDRNYGVAHLALANMLFDDQELQASAEHYELAIKNGQREAYVYYNLGNTYYFMSEFISASNNYKKAIETDPKNADYPYNLGLSLVQSGSLNAAIKQFDQTIALDENYLEAHYNKGKAYFDLDDEMETLKIGDLLMELNPDYGKGYLLMALVYNKRKDYEKQEKYLKLAKKLDPSLRL